MARKQQLTLGVSMKLQHYVQGKWCEGQAQGKELTSAIDGKSMGFADTTGLNFKEILEYGRECGKTLRELTFHTRAQMLKDLALFLLSNKAKYYEISSETGATKTDSWIDIEGGIGNLFVYSSKGRRELPNTKVYVDGKAEPLSKLGGFIGHHICVPMEGIAVHINAFNFPIWGMLEKFAVNFLAGMPALVKPATVTCYLTEAIVKDIVASGILPEGSLQLVCGSAGDMLDHVGSQDVVTFTGSASTGLKLKSHPAVLKNNVRFNMEADSLNCSILGPDAKPGTEDFDIFIKEVTREMTVKAGQKCTAVRRTIVPSDVASDVAAAMIKRLEKITIGDPRSEGVRMGPLASMEQVVEIKEKIAELKSSCEVLWGGTDNFDVVNAEVNKGAFVQPCLLKANNPMENEGVHTIEAFGPVSTIITYNSTEEAIALAKKGEGSLVGSIITSDKEFAKNLTLGCASHHGRLLILNSSCAKESTGHGSPMPQLVHGGPGRAGGGEEMGGIRGIFHYMQRTAIQGHPTDITNVTEVYQLGSNHVESQVHPFRKYFEELNIGESLTTHKRTITEADIVNFGNLSWDHFYAHTDTTSLEGTLFEERVAHGYFIISAAAGLFVDPKRGPVLANYGLDELRFIKPVYAGATIHVKLTVKEKIQQTVKEDEIPRGIVKWQVEVFDDTNEVAALATILTLVQKQPVT
jgi:oxepin-CoA hydrolase/3-oxo-5,6-dehydrosuberyl-CoA semialdehyde dehydrogenase